MDLHGGQRGPCVNLGFLWLLARKSETKAVQSLHALYNLQRRVLKYRVYSILLIARSDGEFCLCDPV
jgi:hypothetical protein